MGKGWNAQYAKLISIHTLIAFGSRGGLIHGGVGQLKPYFWLLFIPNKTLKYCPFSPVTFDLEPPEHQNLDPMNT